MIASLTGILKAKAPTEVLLDVHGVGYAVLIPLSTFERLGAVESTQTLLTYLHLREDAVHLFGFATEEERLFFKLLLSVNGIGPKIAQGILSRISVADLHQHLVRGDISALTAIPGVGKKTAERLIIELRDKIAKLDPLSASAPARTDQEGLRQEALLALTSLGYNRLIAEKALRQAMQESDGTSLSIQDLIKKALRFTGNG